MLQKLLEIRILILILKFKSRIFNKKLYISTQSPLKLI